MPTPLVKAIASGTATVTSTTCKTMHLTPIARLILHAVHTGYKLRVTSGTDEPSSLVWPRMPEREIGPLDDDPVREVLLCGELRQMRRDNIDNRIGWGQMGLDGTKANFYTAQV